jgi:hypothetical protein
METIFQFKTMNEKKKIPLIAALIPLLLLFGAVCCVVMVFKWIFSGKKGVDKHPETVPANAETENHRNETETTHKIPAFRPIPAEIPPAIVSVPKPLIQPVSAPLASMVSASVPAPQKAVSQTTPPAINKKFVTREVMETIFQHGARALTRSAAVAAFKKLGFGKTAAYDALEEDGKFSAWLRFAPDGIITWTDR